jgi:SAM-dependent methyltransferase
LGFPGVVVGWKDRVVRSVNKRGVAATAWLAVLLLVKYLLQIPYWYLIEMFGRLRRWRIPSPAPWFRSLAALWERCTTRSPFNPYYQVLDRRYDRRFSVSTAGVQVLPEIIADPRFNAYGPCPISRGEFFRVLRLIDVDYSQFLFIDYGCGKGKPLFLASELPFKGIIGIELTAPMARAAEENIKSYRGPQKCRSIEVVCGDALEYTPPPEPTIFYFCDPFVAEITAKVIGIIRQSVEAAPRQIFVVYVLPEHREVMDDSGFLKLVKECSGYCLYRSP